MGAGNCSIAELAVPKPAGFRCKHCDHGFMVEVLTDFEREELHRQGRRGGPINCPKCGSPHVERVSE
jgi:transposase-like protein